MTAPRTATLGAPPKPKQANFLPQPPSPIEAKGNIQKAPIKAFNVRLDPDKHDEIKIAAIREKMDLGEYLIFLHDRYQAERMRGGA